jgi:hypothetical protein
MTLDDRLKRAVDSLGDKLRDEIAKELSSLNLEPPHDGKAIGRLAEAMSAIDHAKSLTDILQTLATAASSESARAGVFLLNGSAVRSFKLFRFPSDNAPIELPLSGGGVIADAVQQRKTATSAASAFDPSTSSGSHLPSGVQAAAAIPLVLAGASVGALYVEGADVATVEILARFASRALEAQTAMKAARAFSDRQAL